jgi:hypothetical protein
MYIIYRILAFTVATLPLEHLKPLSHVITAGQVRNVLMTSVQHDPNMIHTSLNSS